jgi:hypothetical protein
VNAGSWLQLHTRDDVLPQPSGSSRQKDILLFLLKCVCAAGGGRFARRKSHAHLLDEEETLSSARQNSSTDGIRPLFGNPTPLSTLESESVRSPIADPISSPQLCTTMQSDDPTIRLLDPDLLAYQQHTATVQPSPRPRSANANASVPSPSSSLLAAITSPRPETRRREVCKPHRGPKARSRNAEVSPPPPRRVWTPRAVPNTPNTPPRSARAPFGSSRPPLIHMTNSTDSNWLHPRSGSPRTPSRPRRPLSPATDIVRPHTAPPSRKKSDQPTTLHDSGSASAVIHPMPPPFMAALHGCRHLMSPRDDTCDSPELRHSTKGNLAVSPAVRLPDDKILVSNTPEGTSLIATGSGDIDTDFVAALSSPSHSESTPLLNSFLASFSEMPNPPLQSSAHEFGHADLCSPVPSSPSPPNSPRPANPVPPSPNQRLSDPLPPSFSPRRSQPLTSFPIACIPDQAPPSPSSRPSDPLPPSVFLPTFCQATPCPSEPLPPSQRLSVSSRTAPDYSGTGSLTFVQLISAGQPLSTPMLPPNLKPLQCAGHGCSISLDPTHECDINLLSFDRDATSACIPRSLETSEKIPNPSDSSAAYPPNPTDALLEPTSADDPYDTLCLPTTALAAAVHSGGSLLGGFSMLSGFRQPHTSADSGSAPTKAATSIDALFATMEAADAAEIAQTEEMHLHCSMDEFIAQVFGRTGQSVGKGSSGPRTDDLHAVSELSGEMVPVLPLSDLLTYLTVKVGLRAKEGRFIAVFGPPTDKSPLCYRAC